MPILKVSRSADLVLDSACEGTGAVVVLAVVGAEVAGVTASMVGAVMVGVLSVPARNRNGRPRTAVCPTPWSRSDRDPAGATRLGG